MKSLIDPLEVVALRNTGLSYEEIGKRLDMNVSTVTGIVWRHIKGKQYLPKPKIEIRKSTLPDRYYHPKWEEET